MRRDRPNPDRTLTGKVALVTGARQGMGRAIAERLSRDGATVCLNDRVAGDDLSEAARSVGGHAFPADVSDPAAVTGLIATVEQKIGTVDVLVANHAYMSMGALADYDLEDWWRVVDTNLTGTFHLVQAVLPGMRRARGGRIVVIASEWGVIGWPRATAYSASKAGLISLVKTLGRELAPEGVIVNAIAPGVVDTPQLQVDADAAGVTRREIVQEYGREIPVGRVGRPDEIAATVSMLADFRIAAIVGQIIQVNGGSTRARA